MFVRTSLTGVITATLAASALVLSATAAHAAATVDPDDTTFTPVAADVIGVGSDTSQNALFRVANAYNAKTPAPTAKLATFAATSGGEIVLPSATINRPNGSGAGKALLYGSGNNADVDFARSSSSLNSNEVSAGLQAFPFALDTLKLAVSGDVASNAPATITPAQMVGIYNGSTTNWSQIGGTSGTIKPLIPQNGSGTRSFFIAQLTAANGGSPVTLAASVTEVQEHDPAPIKDDANAVAPFSAGRAGLAGTALRLEGGFSANRALYNVVRSTDVGNADILGIFGESGFTCSEAARADIEAAGFKQLATAENGGVCGSPTQSATSNFTITAEPDPEPISTTTSLTATSPSARALNLVATVSGSTTPTGSVTFVEDGSGTPLGTVVLSGGTATLNLTGATPGTYTITATYTPTADSLFVTSMGSATVTVLAPEPEPTKVTSKLSEDFKKAYQGTKRATGVVSVALKGAPSSKATGEIVVKEGKKTVGTGTLKKGKATITLKKKKLGKGKSKLIASWSGNTIAKGSKLSFSVKFK